MTWLLAGSCPCCTRGVSSHTSGSSSQTARYTGSVLVAATTAVAAMMLRSASTQVAKTALVAGFAA